MATNGNEHLQNLEGMLRGITALGPVPEAEPETTYDLARRITDAAKAIRDLADYSNNVAADLERITASYISNMGRLLGKLGK